MFCFLYNTEITFKKVDIVDLRREFVYVFGDLKFQFGRKGTEIKNVFFCISVGTIPIFENRLPLMWRVQRTLMTRKTRLLFLFLCYDNVVNKQQQQQEEEGW